MRPPDDDEDVGSATPRAVPDPGAGLLELYDEALPQVYGYLLSRCGDVALAEDLAAECFLAAAVAVRKPEPPRLTVAWLIGVAPHKLVDHWRAQERERRRLRERLRRALETAGGTMTEVTEQTTNEAELAWPPTLTPYITVRDARRALDWYAEVFGATRRGEVYVMPDGSIGHAELGIGDAV